MKSPRKLPKFQPVTVSQWLEGHSERVYAVCGAFTFSLCVREGMVARIERYERPAQIPDYTLKTKMLASTTTLTDYLTLWQEVFGPKMVIAWDASVLAEKEAAK